MRGGKRANEAGYLVGYNSLPQLGREYKRHFGFAPSATWGPLVICNPVVAGPKLILMSQTQKWHPYGCLSGSEGWIRDSGLRVMSSNPISVPSDRQTLQLS